MIDLTPYIPQIIGASALTVVTGILMSCLVVGSDADDQMEELMNKLEKEKDMEEQKKSPKPIRERIMKYQRDKKGRILRDCDGNHLGHRIGIMEAFLLDDKVHIGFSVCFHGDKYDPKKAEFVSYERAFSKKPLTIPPSILRQYEDFRKRCEEHFAGYPLPEYKEFHGKNVHTVTKKVSSYLEMMERSENVTQRGITMTPVEQLKTKYERPAPVVEHPVTLGDVGLDNIQINAEDVPDYLLKEIQ